MEQNVVVFGECRRGNLEALQQLFPDGPTEWRDLSGYSLLRVAAQTPHVHVMDWLLTFPFDVNAPDTGYTPLMWTCFYQQKGMARRLLDHGAALQATDPKGWTALHCACINGWVDGVAWLLEQGADPAVRDRLGRLPEDCLERFSPCYTSLLGLLDAARHGCGLK
jgi:uncharacterized protein